jgi:hypothetical protein
MLIAKLFPMAILTLLLQLNPSGTFTDKPMKNDSGSAYLSPNQTLLIIGVVLFFPCKILHLQHL